MADKRGKLNYASKKGQVTIFIIIGVLVVVGVVLFFVLSGEEEPATPSDTEEITSPSSYMKTCMEDRTRSIIRELSLKGGNIEDSPEVEFRFENEQPRNVSYLCFTQMANRPCDVMEPTLISHLKKEINNRIESDSLMSRCWDSLEENYESKGYTVNGEYNGFESSLKRNKFTIRLNEVDLTLNKGEKTIQTDEIKMIFNSKLYNHAFVANDVAVQQAILGRFDETEYMRQNPEIDITWETAPHGTKIYTVKSREGGIEKFRFAVRSMVSRTYE